MAEAVQNLFPGTQVTIGPNIENGFFYDFARAEPFTPEDMAKIEAEMRRLVGRDLPIVREVWDRQQAIDFFTAKGETFKAEIIRDLPDEPISIYRQGEWLICAEGRHMDPTSARPARRSS